MLFSCDSPWMDQKEMVKRTLRLKLSDGWKEKLLNKNAGVLLGTPAVRKSQR